MSDVEENVDQKEEMVEKSSSKAETTLARAKAVTMIIGAIATAATAVWGAIRQPPEPGARIAYEVLKEALLQERSRYDKLAEELEELRTQVDNCDAKYEAIVDHIKTSNACSGKRIVPSTSVGRAPASNSNITKIEEIAPSPGFSKSSRRKNSVPAPKIPDAEEIGL
jgi:hypothetical protein